MTPRRGFTLVELLVAITVLALLGTALARLLLANSRFVERQQQAIEARHTARSAMILLANDLRMVASGGLLNASATSVTAQVPYAMGVLCGETGGNSVVSVLPVDSSVWADGALGGVGVRQLNGSYVYSGGFSLSPSSAMGECTDDSIRVVPGGRLVEIDGGGLAGPGAPLLLYRVIRYQFAPSGLAPGRTGLFRQVNGGPDVELLAPFASDASFGFIAGVDGAVQNAPPADLSTVTGIELRMFTESEHAGRHGTPARFELAPRIAFVNGSAP